MSEKNGKHAKDYHELHGEEGRKKIAELVKGIKIAMFSSVAEDGTISSRPMAVQDVPFDGTYWFLASVRSEKIDEIRGDRHVNLAFADTSNSKYLSLKGKASYSQDKAKIHELWNDMYKAWFPGGESDPDIAVLRVDIDAGDYWDSNSSKIVLGVKYLAAAVTGGAVPTGESGHVTV